VRGQRPLAPRRTRFSRPPPLRSSPSGGAAISSPIKSNRSCLSSKAIAALHRAHRRQRRTGVKVLDRWPESTPVAWPPGRLDADGSGVSGPGRPTCSTSPLRFLPTRKANLGEGTARSRSLQGGAESRPIWVGEGEPVTSP
jgi:hypothetical protein